MAEKIKIPTHFELVEPTFAALVQLGGSATISEIYECVIAMLNLSDAVIAEPHKGKASQRTELEYQLAWARTRLKNYGAISNSKRGVWMITPEFADKTSISCADVIEPIKKAKHTEKTDVEMKNILNDGDLPDGGIDIQEEQEPWKTELAAVLCNMNPYAFERLAMLLLRECGFSQVHVTKKPGMAVLMVPENYASTEFSVFMLLFSANAILGVFLPEIFVISVDH